MNVDVSLYVTVKKLPMSSKTVEQNVCTVIPVGFLASPWTWIFLVKSMMRAMNSETDPATRISLPPMPSYGTTPPGPMRSTSPGTAMPIMSRFSVASQVPSRISAFMFQLAERKSASKPKRTPRSSAQIERSVSASSSNPKVRFTAGR